MTAVAPTQVFAVRDGLRCRGTLTVLELRMASIVIAFDAEIVSIDERIPFTHTEAMTFAQFYQWTGVDIERQQ